jgi:hypothetical protein
MDEELQACRHCGAPLPWVRDAFCSECFHPLDAPPRPAKVGPRPASGGVPDAEPGPAGLGPLLPVNAVGFMIVAASFGPVWVVCQLLGEGRNAVILATGGPIALALDLGYRLRFSNGDLLRPGLGGKFLWLPMWGFGIFWFVYGLWQLVAGAP